MSKHKHERDRGSGSIPEAGTVGFLDVMAALGKIEGGGGVRIAPLSNTMAVKAVVEKPTLILPPGVQIEHHILGSVVSIGVEGVMPADLAAGKYVGCLVLAERGAAEEMERRMRGLPALSGSGGNGG